MRNSYITIQVWPQVNDTFNERILKRVSMKVFENIEGCLETMTNRFMPKINVSLNIEINQKIKRALKDEFRT